MKRVVGGVLSVLSTGALILVLLAAGLELRLNGYEPPLVGTWIFQASAVVLAGLFLLQLYGAELPVWRKCLSVAGVVLLVCLPLLYFWNPSHSWKPAVGLLPVTYRAFLPAASYVHGAWSSVWLALAAAGILGGGVLLRTRHRMIMVGLIILLATGLVLWVLHDRAIPRRPPVFPWTGWFVNRNHFAAFCCLVFPVAITTGMQIQRRAFLAGKLSSPAVLFYLAAGLFAIGVWQVGSRAGLAIITLQAFGVLLAYGMFMTGFSRRVHIALGIIGCVLLGVFAGYIVYRGGGWGRIGGDLQFRGAVIQDTWRIWKSRPWWGAGPQSFAVVFPYYQSEGLRGYYFHHAHNDPIQMLAEWGVLGLGWLLVAIWFTLQGGKVATSRMRAFTSYDHMEVSGIVFALGGVLLHSLVDFPLQHPQIMLLVCVWVALLGKIFGRCNKLSESTLH